MGLNIVKKIIDKIKGEIKVNSEPNKLTTFTITLKSYISKKPVDIEEFSPSQPMGIKPVQAFPKDRVNQNSNYNIFIIEDNLEMINFLHNSMPEKFNVFCAPNGQKALEKIDNIPKPNIIMSDIMMDIMDGYKFCEIIFRDNKYNDIPFIFLTAKSIEKEKIKGLNMGAIDFITKPFIIDELIAKINSIIKNQDAQHNRTIDTIEDELNSFLTRRIKEIDKKTIPGSKYNDPYKEFYVKYNISEKESSIIKLLIEGYEYREIAIKLDIHVKLIKTDLKQIYKKCKINSKIELLDILKADE